MNFQPFDAIITGAGIAGSCAALTLAQRGARVALLEAGQFPRHKVCGEFLSPESQSTFNRLGLSDAIQAAQPSRVITARLISHTGVVAQIPLPAEAIALSRYRLDQILWDAAYAAGVWCVDRTRVRHVTGNFASGFKITTTNSTFQARCLIAAPGRHASWLTTSPPHNPTTSPPRFLGMKAHFTNVRLEPDVVELYGWRGGYCGVVQVEDGITNVCLLARYDIMKSRTQRSPVVLWNWLLEQCLPLARRMAGAQQSMDWLTTGNVSFDSICPVSGDILHCGDAAGFIGPLTGDGMAMAARSGELAATVVATHLRGDLSCEDVAPLYAAAWQREFGKRLRWAAALQPLLISPRLTTPAIAVLARAPRLAQLSIINTRGRL